MPDHIPFGTARKYAEDNRLRQVVIMGWDGKRTHVLTYGRTVEESDQAAHGGNLVKHALGWPDSLCNDEPSRVTKLRERIADLEAQLP